eukprot:gnl/MRDRNA2_/MRDRNA2_144473_c0_seq1.p1 gnl/MRDRNA2_/MRDRNA2_144473_c0~~gnl/MRDRNA2_/MRDRNA2_144473_c0_seq1.p1  ORF type:complete len:195 (-),score=31.58 gnl/MRDRNA2_/MRDRNA2_144473_c0_seq1:156-740(-)
MRCSWSWALRCFLFVVLAQHGQGKGKGPGMTKEVSGIHGARLDVEFSRKAPGSVIEFDLEFSEEKKSTRLNFCYHAAQDYIKITSKEIQASVAMLTTQMGLSKEQAFHYVTFQTSMACYQNIRDELLHDDKPVSEMSSDELSEIFKSPTDPDGKPTQPREEHMKLFEALVQSGPEKKKQKRKKKEERKKDGSEL